MIKNVIGKYIAVNKLVQETEKMGDGQFEYTSKDVSQMRAQRGVVVKYGLDVEGINEGDKILFDKSRAFIVIIDGEQITMIREDAVILTE